MKSFPIRCALAAALVGATLASACGNESTTPADTPRDPNTAARVSVDRFSVAAGTLFERTPTNGMPGPNVAVDFDQGPFVTDGFGPNGERVRYYNFDIMTDAPAPIFVFFREGETAPMAGQLNVIDVLPGEAGYNDFWQVVRVIVPQSYVANTVTSLQGIVARGFRRETTNMLVNCPVVPAGSTARLRTQGSAELLRGWHRDQVVSYFTFDEKAVLTTPQNRVPVSPIFVAFNINPGDAGGGPPSGFRVEAGTSLTHNVLATLPTNPAYSPLWTVVVYHNQDFSRVQNLATAQAARILVPSAGLVNCPIARIQ